VARDLADGSTTAEYRRVLPNALNRWHVESLGRLKHMGVAFHGKPIVRTVTNFVIGRLVDAPMSVHRSAPKRSSRWKRASAPDSRRSGVGPWGGRGLAKARRGSPMPKGAFASSFVNGHRPRPVSNWVLSGKS
jgi:hypothetical protein